jgi:hypothetical protein
MQGQADLPNSAEVLVDWESGEGTMLTFTVNANSIGWIAKTMKMLVLAPRSLRDTTRTQPIMTPWLVRIMGRRKLTLRWSVSRTMVMPLLPTRASPLIIEDANLSAEGAEEKNWEPIDVIRRGFLGATLGREARGMLESHTPGSNADRMDVSNGLILFENP